MQNPYGAPPSPGYGPPSGGSPLSTTAVQQAKTARAWGKFVGIVTMVFGGLYSITIIYAIIGVPLIFMGLWDYNISQELGRYAETGETDALEKVMAKQRNLMVMKGIFFIVGIIGFVLLLALYGAVFAAMILGAIAAKK